MLIDSFLERLKKAPHQITWIRTAQSRETPVAEINQSLETILKKIVPFDLGPMHGTLESAYGEKPFRFVRDCFAPIPPFPNCGFERIDAGVRVLTVMNMVEVEDIQPRVRKYFLREEALKREGFRSFEMKYFQKGEPLSEMVDVEGAEYFVAVSSLFHIDKSDMFIVFDDYAGYYISKHGSLLTSPIVNPHVMRDRFLMEQSETGHQLFELCLRNFSISTMAQNLLACKNVSSQTREIDAKLQKRRARDQKPPLCEYRQIVIEAPPGRRTNLSAEQNDSEVKRRLHMVRGHFADYREKGLFGKYKGVFFFPAHLRGDESSGEIRKTGYKVVPPKAGDNSQIIPPTQS